MCFYDENKAGISDSHYHRMGGAAAEASVGNAVEPCVATPESEYLRSASYIGFGLLCGAGVTLYMKRTKPEYASLLENEII